MNELPTTANGTFSLLPQTKAEVNSFFNLLKKEILGGEIDPLQFMVRFQGISELIEMIDKDQDIRRATLNEDDKYGQKTFKLHGATVQVKDVGVRYDFTQCGSADWKFKSDLIESHKANLKKLEEFLKHVPESGMVDPQTGEFIYPPARKSTTTVIIKLD